MVVVVKARLKKVFLLVAAVTRALGAGVVVDVVEVVEVVVVLVVVVVVGVVQATFRA